MSGRGVLLTGEAGCGKTTSHSTLAKALTSLYYAGVEGREVEAPPQGTAPLAEVDYPKVDVEVVCPNTLTPDEVPVDNVSLLLWIPSDFDVDVSVPSCLFHCRIFAVVWFHFLRQRLAERLVWKNV